MEDILYELGLAKYSEVLKAKSVSFSTFKALVSSSANQKMMRESIMLECGLNDGQIIAISSKVREVIDKHNFMANSNSYHKSPLTPTLNYNSKAPNVSRRAMLLQQQPNRSKSPND